MSKKVKNLIEKQIEADLQGIDGIAVINPRGIDALKNNAIRRKLSEKGLRMRVVKNTLARRASERSKVKGFGSLLDGPSAVIFGKASISTIARLLLDEKKLNDKIELRGMFFDGEVYVGEEGVKTVSTMPTREEAIGNIVALALAPGAKLSGIFKSQAGKIAAIIKAVEEKAEKAEKAGGAAAPAAPAADAPATA